MKFFLAAALALTVIAAGFAAAAPAAEGGARFVFERHGSTGWMPLQVGADHHAYFDVKVNGRAAVGMIDPNTPHTTLDASFAARGGVTADAPLQLDFPRLAILGLQPAIRDLAPLSAALGHPVDVIVGSDALNGVVADIDLLGHRLSLNDEAGFTFPDVARYTHLVHRGDVWLAPVSIEGRRPGLFALDMLASDYLQIAPDYAHELGLAPTAHAMLVADDGAVPVSQTQLHQIKFAGVVMTDVTADVPDRLRSAYDHEARGALGVDVLRRYRLIVDLQHERLYTMLINTNGLNLDLFTLLRPGTEPNFGARPAGAF